ncbi:MAG: winged helix DNA-binding domain-containing protein [Acidimicrobiia bacterium]
MDVISRRALNRTTLHRQSLLARSTGPASGMIEHLVGMQAQNPNDPYWALWSRLEGLTVDELSGMISRREAVRGQLMRATIHLATTHDYLAIRPQLGPVFARTLGSTVFARDTTDVDREALLAMARGLLEERPMTRAELGPLLGERWPGIPVASLAQVATYLLPVIQVPPRGLWQQPGEAAWTTIESWVGRSLGAQSFAEGTIRRYLAAFGPASVGDMRMWSGMAGLREVVDRMRKPKLRRYRDERGTELLDLPQLSLVDEDTPAPPRFLPEYDNVLLGHNDRSRFFLEDIVPKAWTGNLLVDGVLSGAWKTAARRRPRLEIELARKISRSELEAVSEEAERLRAFTFPNIDDGEILLRRDY